MKRRSFILKTLVALAFTMSSVSLLAQEGEQSTKLLRYPDIHGEQVVFCYAGDIWKSDLDGRNVVRLTAHPGQEVFPKFSPDGTWLGVTGP